MIKDIIIRIVLLVVFLAAVVAVGNGLTKQYCEIEGVDVMLNRGGALAGMGRFLADVNWMRLLQFRAACSERKPDDAVAEALYRRYDAITDENPFFVKAYEHGGLDLATMGKPDLAIRLLDKGIEALGESNWKLPHYAAHISSFYLKDEAGTKRYLQLACDRPGHPFFLESALVRIRARKMGNDPLVVARLWQAVSPSPEMSEGLGMMEHDVGLFGKGYHENIRKRVVVLLRGVRNQADKASGPEKAKLAAKAVEIEKIVRDMMPTANVCGYCFAEYAPGDKFCHNCGRKVKLYGVCPKCGGVNKGKYCRQCGTKMPVIKRAPKLPHAKPEKIGKKGKKKG